MLGGGWGVGCAPAMFLMARLRGSANLRADLLLPLPRCHPLGPVPFALYAVIPRRCGQVKVGQPSETKGQHVLQIHKYSIFPQLPGPARATVAYTGMVQVLFLAHGRIAHLHIPSDHLLLQ